MNKTQSVALICIAAMAVVFIVPGCSETTRSRRAGSKSASRELPPPSPAEIASAVKAGTGRACKLDLECDMYLRCYDEKCSIPRAITGVAGEDQAVVAISTDKGEAQFFVELAITPKERSRGLMFRQSMDPRWGMVFIYDKDRPMSFWMKNTYIPLDMVFINSEKQVVGVLENVPPQSLEDRKVEKDSQYVLELVAGQAREYGIAEGNSVVFANFP